MPRRPEPPLETEEERWLRDEQTRRNMLAMEAEQQGHLADALLLYERNVTEGFPGDWPYGRLVSIYEQRRQFDDAERVLLRAIEVQRTSHYRTAQDRQAMVRVFRQRLKRLAQLRKQAQSSA